MDSPFITEAHRIYLPGKTGKPLAEITFEQVAPNTYDIYHTFVDASLRGQGIAHALVQAALKHLTGQGFSVTASCSYAKKHLKS